MKTKIKREELKRIYEISCASWKPKIEKYAAKNPFSEEIEFIEEQIKEMLAASTEEQLPIVKEVFDVKDVSDELNTFDKVCRALNTTEEEFKKKYSVLNEQQYATIQAEYIAKAYNQEWTPDWKNNNQAKWFICWNMETNSFYDSDDCHWLSNAASALCFETSDKCQSASKNFKEIYSKYFLG
jgi:hypothetical protein